eukprot:7953326-Pyramimonas_sp.AAC.1
MEDFPLGGERSTMWLMRCVRDRGGTFGGRQTEWALEHKIDRSSAAYLMRGLLGLALDFGACYDQLGVANLGCVEVLSRMCQL